MKNTKGTTRTGLIIAMIFGAACFRFINIAPNFSPIVGMSLFGAAYFSRKYLAFLVPFLALWFSNLILDNVFYAEWYDGFQWFSQPFVFLGFAAIAFLGMNILKKISFGRVLAASLSASVLFFLVSNFGSWLGGSLYPKDFSGLIACYAAGIPFLTNPAGAEHYFFLNTMIGDLFFSGLLFGAFELAKANFPRLVLAD